MRNQIVHLISILVQHKTVYLFMKKNKKQNKRNAAQAAILVIQTYSTYYHSTSTNHTTNPIADSSHLQSDI